MAKVPHVAGLLCSKRRLGDAASEQTEEVEQTLHQRIRDELARRMPYAKPLVSLTALQPP